MVGERAKGVKQMLNIILLYVVTAYICSMEQIVMKVFDLGDAGGQRPPSVNSYRHEEDKGTAQICVRNDWC